MKPEREYKLLSRTFFQSDMGSIAEQGFMINKFDLDSLVIKWSTSIG